MRAKILLFGAAAMAVVPTFASAQTAPGQGQFNGSGYNHLNSGNALGQPSQSCQTINGGLTGPFYPGNANSAPGSAFNEAGPGTGGTHYAGNVPQSQRNTASVAQYDVACANQAR